MHIPDDIDNVCSMLVLHSWIINHSNKKLHTNRCIKVHGNCELSILSSFYSFFFSHFAHFGSATLDAKQLEVFVIFIQTNGVTIWTVWIWLLLPSEYDSHWLAYIQFHISTEIRGKLRRPIFSIIFHNTLAMYLILSFSLWKLMILL